VVMWHRKKCNYNRAPTKGRIEAFHIYAQKSTLTITAPYSLEYTMANNGRYLDNLAEGGEAKDNPREGQ